VNNNLGFFSKMVEEFSLEDKEWLGWNWRKFKIGHKVGRLH
jgi:hypothetical protein